MDRRQRDIKDAILARTRRETLLMGILNATPDSFSDGGKFDQIETASAHAAQMTLDGADIIDIGGESTRPGAAPVSAADEHARTIPLIEHLYTNSDTPLSIDTYKADIAHSAVKAGAVIINDVWGMTRDEKMASAAASTGAAIIITYNRGKTDETISLIDDMRAFFDRAFDSARATGIPKEHIWLDPGVGFSKTLAQNFEILRRLDAMLDYDCPVLVGLSRKSFIGLTLDRPVDERLPATLAAHLNAVQKGAHVLRVHDVAAHKDALTITQTIDKAPT